jgi:nicotinate-nucleotide pyrophosphorylase (carboxylating)
MENISETQLLHFIEQALDEDVRDGDHTSLACVPADAFGSAKLLVKDEGILAGVALASEIFRYVDPGFQLKIHMEDGAKIKPGDIAFEVHGSSQAILKAERLVLNSMQRMSGIATMTHQFTELVKDLPVTILDTRKTTPLLRFLEKWAVRIGGGTNYRTGLYDRIMIKDNHVDFCGSLTKAIERVWDYLKEKELDLQITVEVRDMKELEEVLNKGGIQRIMLDNFDTDTMRQAVKFVDKKYELEASGGITLETVRAYAETGVDFISVGALTHSYQSLDLSLKKQ